jgi:hypothetical protein
MYISTFKSTNPHYKPKIYTIENNIYFEVMVADNQLPVKVKFSWAIKFRNALSICFSFKLALPLFQSKVICDLK